LESIGVGVKKTLLHLFIIDQSIVGILEDEVVDFSGVADHPKSITETLLDLTDSFVTGGEHTFVKLGVQELGTSIKRTVSDKDRTWALAVVVSAMNMGFFLSSRSSD
jgi:hypothetical protein